MQQTRSIHSAVNSVATILLLLVFLFQVYNKVVYTHTHILADGTSITHAHPYKKTSDSEPIASHQHTNGQFFLLSLVQLLYFFFATALIARFVSTCISFEAKTISFSLHSGSFRLKNKSPPFFA